MLGRQRRGRQHPHDRARGGIVVSANRTGTSTRSGSSLDDDIARATPAGRTSATASRRRRRRPRLHFGNFELLSRRALDACRRRPRPRGDDEPARSELTVATFNVENLDPGDGPAIRRARRADRREPPVAGDRRRSRRSRTTTARRTTATTDATLTWEMLIAAIEAAGGPTYDYRQIDPVNNQDGGEPGGNIRVGFLFRTGSRPRPSSTGRAATPTTPTGGRRVTRPGAPELLSARAASTRRTRLREHAASRWRASSSGAARRCIAIANHFNSKGGDDPLFGRFQPPVRRARSQRHQQAADRERLRRPDPRGPDTKCERRRARRHQRLRVLETLDILEGGVLVNLVETLPQAGAVLVRLRGELAGARPDPRQPSRCEARRGYDVVHVNAEFADQASDHDPSVARLDVYGRGAGDER